MPVGDSHLAFAEAAAQDGVVLKNTVDLPWLTELGHITLEHMAEEPPEAASAEALGTAAEVLDSIFLDLKGDIDVLVACRVTLLMPIELMHEPTGTLIEIDEAHHFTSFRLAALDSYPADVKLGFDLDEYRELCRAGAKEQDGYRRNLPAKGFGFGGIQRDRAYRDSVRDLGAPAMGHPRLVRIAAIDGDGAAAYERNQEKLLNLLGAAR
ncbi:MAG: DUF7255 family protein [Solirubrobacteraceae bacterium]